MIVKWVIFEHLHLLENLIMNLVTLNMQEPSGWASLKCYFLLAKVWKPKMFSHTRLQAQLWMVVQVKSAHVVVASASLTKVFFSLCIYSNVFKFICDSFEGLRHIHVIRAAVYYSKGVLVKWQLKEPSISTSQERNKLAHHGGGNWSDQRAEEEKCVRTETKNATEKGLDPEDHKRCLIR